nr:retrotransposon protein, putative, Ty1-copia subclass [Tanacetum cinerariifolium]
DKKKPQRAKGKNKGKNKLAYAPKAKISPPPKRDNPTKDSICHHCKKVVTGGGIGLKESRKLKHGALSLYMGNGMRVAVKAIRSSDLILPSGLIIVLDSSHFAPTVTRGVVITFCLVNNVYIHTFTNYGISISKDNVIYFNAIPHDGEAAYILGVKIICDRSKRLIAFSQSTYREKILKKFRIENSKKRYTPMMEKPNYRKSQGAKTPSDVLCTQRVPYASAIGSIIGGALLWKRGVLLLMLTNKGWVDGNDSNPDGGFRKPGGSRETRGGGDGLEEPDGQLSMV